MFSVYYGLCSLLGCTWFREGMERMLAAMCSYIGGRLMGVSTALRFSIQ